MTTNSPQNAVQLRDGAVSIDDRPILRHIDFQVEPGEFVALMGANGSGKSTLVRSLVGLLPLQQGELSLFGTPFQHFKKWSQVGYVPQRGGAVSGVPASVWEVVASGRLSRRRLLRPLTKADRAAIAEALEVVGMSPFTKRGLAELSGGQQQRVLIARALASGPQLLFLDEPTAGVDLPNQQALSASLRLLSDNGATIVLVAHELGPLEPLVQRTVVMTDGRIGYDGPPLNHHGIQDGGLMGHHHHEWERPDSHTPGVASPFDTGSLHAAFDPEGGAR